MTIETQEMPNSTENSTQIIYETQKKSPIYAYSMNELEKLRFVNQNEQKMRWKDVYESLESDVVKEYDGLQTQDLPDKNKQKKQKKKLSSESKVLDVAEEYDGLHIQDLPDKKKQKKKKKLSAESKVLDVAKEYDGLQTQDLPDKKKQEKKKKKLSAESKVLDDMEHDVVNERGSDDWISNNVSDLGNREIHLFVQDNGVQMEDKGLIVDVLQESMHNVSDLGEKIDVQRSVDRRMSEGEKVFGNSKVLSYSRSEMETFRLVNVEEQERWWKEVHDKLSSDIVEELDGLRADSNWKQERSRNDVGKQSARNKAVLSNHLGEMLGIKTTEGLDVLNICDDIVDCSGKCMDILEPLDEYDNVDDDDSSSDEYGSIQRPAFLVEGEPDFESGPPLDGLEYLRRVRWEAAQIPKIKVVKLDSSKLTSEQTAYMPSIPYIPKCPSMLLPSKDWENAFLAEFSELRQAISMLEESSSTEPSLNKASQQSISVEQLKKNAPTLTAILGMDAVTRAATLRNYVTSLESMDRLSKDDCLWLFALCAAVDTPLHANTCASLRCLLRKCCSILVLKSEPDDEVAMLSILIAVTGKYFGQLDS